MTVFSTGFTLITSRGKVRNMNQRLMPIALRISLRVSMIIVAEAGSCPTSDFVDGGLAEQAGRSENQDKDQQGKGKGIFIVARYITGGKGFSEAEDKTAQNRSRNRADAAENCGGEGLDASNKADGAV